MARTLAIGTTTPLDALQLLRMGVDELGVSGVSAFTKRYWLSISAFHLVHHTVRRRVEASKYLMLFVVPCSCATGYSSGYLIGARADFISFHPEIRRVRWRLPGFVCV